MVKENSSDEFRMGEVTASISSMRGAIDKLSDCLSAVNMKLDNIGEALVEGKGLFKDLEHKDILIDMRVKALEDARDRFAATKQSVGMMLLDKGIGIILPWAAIAYVVWGKGPTP